jgi:hypothetical protein
VVVTQIPVNEVLNLGGVNVHLHLPQFEIGSIPRKVQVRA